MTTQKRKRPNEYLPNQQPLGIFPQRIEHDIDEAFRAIPSPGDIRAEVPAYSDGGGAEGPSGPSGPPGLDGEDGEDGFMGPPGLTFGEALRLTAMGV